MVPVAIAAGAALFAGGVALGKALSNGDKQTEELVTRQIPESEVPAHIREKVLRNRRKQ